MIRTRLIFLSEGEAPRILTLGEMGEETRDILVVPGAEAAARWLDLEGRTQAQARAFAAFQLADELAGGTEGLHIAVGPPDAAGRLTVVVEEARLRGWLAEAAALGIKPAAVVPDHLMLRPEEGVVVAARFGPLMAARGERLALSAEPELVETVLEGRAWRLVEGAELEAMLALQAASPPVDLLQGAFARRDPALRRADLIRAAVLAAVLVASPLALLLAGIARDELAARAMLDQARAAAAHAGAADLAALDARLSRLRAADGFPALAAGFFAAVEKVPAVRLETLVYSADGAIRSTLAYGAYSDMDRLREAAAGAGLVIEEDSTLTEGAQITSDVVVRSRP